MLKEITLPPGSYKLDIPGYDEKCIMCNVVLWKETKTELVPVLTPKHGSVYVHKGCFEQQKTGNPKPKAVFSAQSQQIN